MCVRKNWVSNGWGYNIIIIIERLCSKMDQKLKLKLEANECVGKNKKKNKKTQFKAKHS